MKRGTLICFVGIDGSGKTTLAKRISKELNQENFNTIYLYGRIVPIISRFFMYLGRALVLRRKKNDIFNDYQGYSKQKKKVFSNEFFSNAFKWIILFDHILQINFKIKTRLLMGKTVICDRYIYDTVITDIAANINLEAAESTNLIKKTFHYIPEPDYLFYINIPEKIAYERKDDVPHLDYLIERKKLYDALEQSFEIIELDGTNTVDEISSKVKTKLIHSLRGAMK
jgi:thymidylate kinase